MGPLLDPKVWPELYGTPSVSTRISIARPPSLPYEDSDVLVLSSRSTLPDSTMAGNVLLYLDLRLSLPVTSTSKVNWAFAGRRYTISGEGRGGGGDLATTLRYRWEHIIDSHGSGGPPDEGAVVKRLEGGKEVEVEIGVGLNPNTGKIEAYEEVWNDEELPNATPFAFLMSGPNPTESTSFMAVLGEHAVALSQYKANDSGQDISDVTSAEVGAFQAVRLLRRATIPDKVCWSTVFSTGQQGLEEQLEGLVEQLTSRTREGQEPWKRGEAVEIERQRCERPEQKRQWTVWDAGYVAE